MNIQLLEAPPVEPVTLQHVYDHLRLTPDPGSPGGTPEDEMLLRQIRTARLEVERKTRRALVKQKVRLVCGPNDRDAWPWYRSYDARAAGLTCRGIELPRPPFLQLLEISYYDAANVLTLVDPLNYYVTDDEPARLFFIDGYQLPFVYPRGDTLRIDYYAGYPPVGSPEDDFVSNVPEDLKAAILLGVELQHEALQPDQRASLERARDNLLEPLTVLIAV